MKLTIKERLIIQGILINKMPLKGSFVEMLNVNNLKEQILISIDEVNKYNFRDTPEGNIIWDMQTHSDKEIELTAQQIDLLQLAVYALDEEKSIDMEIFPLCQKILQLT